MTWPRFHLLATSSHRSQAPIRRNWAPRPAELVNTNVSTSISRSAVLISSHFSLSLCPWLSLIPPLSVFLLHFSPTLCQQSILRLWDSNCCKIILRPGCWGMQDHIHISHHNRLYCIYISLLIKSDRWSFSCWPDSFSTGEKKTVLEFPIKNQYKIIF